MEFISLKGVKTPVYYYPELWVNSYLRDGGLRENNQVL